MAVGFEQWIPRDLRKVASIGLLRHLVDYIQVANPFFPPLKALMTRCSANCV